jgi:hypothetical protein
MATKIKGGGARKYGRNKLSCDTYKRDGRRELNKALRLKKHLVRFPNDAGAKAALAQLKG